MARYPMLMMLCALLLSLGWLALGSEAESGIATSPPDLGLPEDPTVAETNVTVLVDAERPKEGKKPFRRFHHGGRRYKSQTEERQPVYVMPELQVRQEVPLNKRPNSRSHSISSVNINLGSAAGPPVVIDGDDEGGNEDEERRRRKAHTYSAPRCSPGSDFVASSKHLFNCSCPQASYCSYTNLVPVSDQLDQSCWLPLAAAHFVEHLGVCSRMPSLKKFARREGGPPLRLIMYQGNYFLDFGCTKFAKLKRAFFVDLDTCKGDVIPFTVEKGPVNFDKRSTKETEKSNQVVGLISLSRTYRAPASAPEKPKRKRLTTKSSTKKRRHHHKSRRNY